MKTQITKEQQLKELTSRITPIVNVDIIVRKDDTFLIAHRNPSWENDPDSQWLFPGGRMKYFESPQETAVRKLKEELPGVEATLKKLVTVIADNGYDHRACGVTIYYLFDYESGEPQPNEQLDRFKWVTLDEMKEMDTFYELEKQILHEVSQTLMFINSNEDELLVQVDENDLEIGYVDKKKAHSDNSVYHRSALILVFNSNGEIVLHKRSKYKPSSPLKWDFFGGHNNYGSTIDATAKQELIEELGVDIDLKFLYKKLKRTDSQSEFMYFYYGVSDGPYAFDRNEVAEVKSFNVENLLSGKYDNEYEILPHVKEVLQEYSKANP